MGKGGNLASSSPASTSGLQFTALDLQLYEYRVLMHEY
jgi:hypothetical protein